MLGIAATVVMIGSASRAAGSVQAVLRTLPQARSRWLLFVAGASVVVLFVNMSIYKTRWDVSPFRALPVLCLGVIFTATCGDATAIRKPTCTAARFSCSLSIVLRCLRA